MDLHLALSLLSYFSFSFLFFNFLLISVFSFVLFFSDGYSRLLFLLMSRFYITSHAGRLILGY